MKPEIETDLKADDKVAVGLEKSPRIIGHFYTNSVPPSSQWPWFERVACRVEYLLVRGLSQNYREPWQHKPERINNGVTRPVSLQA